MKSQHERHSPIFEGLAVLAEVAAEEVAPSQGMKGEVYCPVAVTVSLS